MDQGKQVCFAQRSRFSWMRSGIWSCHFVSSSDGVRGGSSSHYHTDHAHDAAHGYVKSGTERRQERRSGRAERRQERRTGRAERRQERRKDVMSDGTRATAPPPPRPSKVIIRSRRQQQRSRRRADPRKAMQRSAARASTTGPPSVKAQAPVMALPSLHQTMRAFRLAMGPRTQA